MPPSRRDPRDRHGHGCRRLWCAAASHRTDRLPTAMNAGKGVRSATGFERGAGRLRPSRPTGARAFAATAASGKTYSQPRKAGAPGVAAAKAGIGAPRMQMVRDPVVGTLTPSVSNRPTDVAAIAGRPDAFDGPTRPMLRMVNKAQGRFDRRRDIVMPDTGEADPGRCPRSGPTGRAAVAEAPPQAVVPTRRDGDRPPTGEPGRRRRRDGVFRCGCALERGTRAGGSRSRSRPTRTSRVDEAGAAGRFRSTTATTARFGSP